jgi:hypothetical protein
MITFVIPLPPPICDTPPIVWDVPGMVRGSKIARPRFFAAIIQLEGHRWSDPGGALAIALVTWRQHTRLPYRFASDPAYAYPLAERHLDWLSRSLAADGFAVSVMNLALCWRWGFEGGKRAILARRWDYGQRAENLYSEFR